MEVEEEQSYISLGGGRECLIEKGKGSKQQRNRDEKLEVS